MELCAYETYKVNDQLIFILTDKKTIVKTPYQTNMIIYEDGNYRKRWELLRLKIKNGQIKSIYDLLRHNDPKIGSSSRIQGLLMVPTKLERHI